MLFSSCLGSFRSLGNPSGFFKCQLYCVKPKTHNHDKSFDCISSKIFKLKVKLSKKTRFKWFQCNHMIHIHTIPSQFLLPSPFKPKYITPPNETVTCVCADLTTLADIYHKLEWKYTSFVQILINLLLFNYIIFVYACAEWLFHFSRLYKYFTYV